MKWEVFWLVLYVSRKCSTSDAGEYIYFHWTLLAVFSIIIVANIWSHICGHCTVQFVFTAYLTCKSMRPRCNLSKSVDVVLFLYCWLFCQKYIPWSIYYSTVFSFFFFFFFLQESNGQWDLRNYDYMSILQILTRIMIKYVVWWLYIFK